MTLENLMNGLTILREHFGEEAGYVIGAEHDQFFVYQTTKPMNKAAVVAMRQLGWNQYDKAGDDVDDPETATEDELFAAYDPEASWSCFT